MEGGGDMDLALHNAMYAEGIAMEQAKNFPKALAAFNRAIIAVSPNGVLSINEARLCLTARSRLHLQLGDATAALKDAEDSLSDNPNYIKGLFAKAEALYFQSDFEFALLFFHRGHRLRPELGEFRLGISKSQEAIENAIGDPEACKLHAAEGIENFWHDPNAGKGRKAGRPVPRAVSTRRRSSARANANDKNARQLLGDLYVDKLFLESLLNDTSFATEADQGLKELISDGLKYLDRRTDFWRQQKPLYAREHEAKQRSRRFEPAASLRSTANKKTVAKQKTKNAAAIVSQLDAMEQASELEEHAEVLAIGERLLKLVTGDVPDSNRIRGEVYALMGNAHLELDNFDLALELHVKDLDSAISDEARSRALGNVGCTYARLGQFDRAVEHWLDKVPLSSSPVESAWLCHEIGRAYLADSKPLPALEYGQKAQTAASEGCDTRWMMNAGILVAQAHLQLGELSEAQETYHAAKLMAADLCDSSAETALEKALDALAVQMDAGLDDMETA